MPWYASVLAVMVRSVLGFVLLETGLDGSCSLVGGLSSGSRRSMLSRYCKGKLFLSESSRSSRNVFLARNDDIRKLKFRRAVRFRVSVQPQLRECWSHLALVLVGPRSDGIRCK